MRFTPERFTVGELPSVQELNQLAVIWRESAEGRGILKGQGGAAQHYMHTIFEAPIEVNGKLVVLEQAVGVKIGDHYNVDDDHRTVQMLDYHNAARVQGGGLASIAIRYSFIWGEDTVFKARRNLPAGYPYDTLSPEECLLWDKEHFMIDDAAATMLGSRIDFSEVTSGDCKLLMKEAKDHFTLLDSLRSDHL